MQKKYSMDSEEIRDEIFQEEELPQKSVKFDLRDAIIYSTILERKYN